MGSKDQSSPASSSNAPVLQPSFLHGITPPPPLQIDSNITDNWKQFKRQWNNYAIITNLNTQTEAYRVALFLHCIGSDALKIYDGLQFTEGTFVIADNFTLSDIAESLVISPGREDNDDGFYMMNINEVINKYQKWVELLPRVRPFYAVKCNPDPILVRLLSKLGTGFDCASKGEIKLAMELGVSPRDVIYANTCKKKSHIRFAEECGVTMMTFDSEEELHKIKDTYPDSEILLRFRPPSHNARYDVNGLKFGAAIHDCSDLLMNAKNMELNVTGVSFHVGSESLDATPIRDAIQTAKAIFDIAEKVGFSFNILDIGGGFSGRPSEIHFEKFCKVITPALDKCFPVSSGVRIIAEPGRYFACSPFTLVTNVIAVKEIPKHQLDERKKKDLPFTKDGVNVGYMYYIDDGAFGSFSEIFYCDDLNFDPKPLKVRSSSSFPSCIWGQTCTTLDTVNKNCRLPKLSVGDWLYFENMGAYTSAICSGFNGFPSVRHTYYYGTTKTWKTLKMSKEDFDYGILEL